MRYEDGLRGCLPSTLRSVNRSLPASFALPTLATGAAAEEHPDQAARQMLAPLVDSARVDMLKGERTAPTNMGEAQYCREVVNRTVGTPFLFLVQLSRGGTP